MKKLLLVTLLMAGILSGCTQMIELTNEEEDLIAEYAAGRMINFYKENTGEKPKKSALNASVENAANQQNQINKKDDANTSTSDIPLKKEDENTANVEGADVDINKTEIEKTEVDMSEKLDKTDNEKGQNSQQSATSSGGNTLVELLNVTNVDITPVGYSVNAKYPMDAYSFSVDAPTGYKLLVVEYEVKNNTGIDTVMGVDASKASIKALINNSESVTIYRTMLKSDITNMDGVKLKAGESKTGVLIFRIKDAVAESVESVNVNISAK